MKGMFFCFLGSTEKLVTFLDGLFSCLGSVCAIPGSGIRDWHVMGCFALKPLNEYVTLTYTFS